MCAVVIEVETEGLVAVRMCQSEAYLTNDRLRGRRMFPVLYFKKLLLVLFTWQCIYCESTGKLR